MSVDVPDSSFILFLSGRWWSKLPSTYFFHTIKVCLSTALLCYWSALSLELVSLQCISWLTSEFIEWCSIFAVTLHISLISEMYYEGHNFSYDTLLSFSREFFQLKVRMLLLMCVFLDNQFVLCGCGQL